MTAKQHLIEQLRNLPTHRIDAHPNATLIQAAAAGRLVRDAMNKGFIDSGTLRELWEQAEQNCPRDQRDSAFWILIFQAMLSGCVSSNSLGWEYKFSDDCRLMADMISEADEPESNVDHHATTDHESKKTVFVRVKSRLPEHGDRAGGRIEIERLFEGRYWEGAGIGGLKEYACELPKDGGWFIYRPALERQLECYSPDDEQEEHKIYIDEAASAIRTSIPEVLTWFNRNGATPPLELFEATAKTAAANDPTPPTELPETQPGESKSTRRGRLPTGDSEAKRMHMLATLREHGSMKDAPAALANMIGTSEKTVRRWLAQEEKKYNESKAAIADPDQCRDD